MSERANVTVDRFKDLFNQLNAQTVEGDLLASVYTPDMVFEDCFHHVEGLGHFQDYCRNLYQNLTHCRFVFTDTVIDGQQAMLRWEMSYAHPKLNGGKDILVDGVSQIKFDEKVSYHRDFIDAGQMLYEHIPLMGSAIRFLKKRMNA